MDISKTVVDKAGRALRGGDVFSGEYGRAVEILSAWRNIHAKPLREVEQLFNGYLSAGFKHYLLSYRLKRFVSIVDKLKRFPDMSLARMQDVGGLRVIMDKIDDVYKLRESIDDVSQIHDYISKPKFDGYRSLHLIINCEIVKIEAQLRTKLQHSWATAVETLGLLTNNCIKIGGGEDSHKKYFKLSSALFSVQEGCSVIDCYKEYTYQQLVDELGEIDSKFNISKKLKGVANSINKILSSNNDAYYYLLELNSNKGEVNIVSFPEEQVSYAEMIYKSREQMSISDPEISVVLLGVNRINDIKEAYPNYFLDANMFLRNLEKING